MRDKSSTLPQHLHHAGVPNSLVSTNGVPMSKLDWLTQEIDGLKEQGLYNRIRTIGSAQGAWLTVDGKNVLNFCSNNYLGPGKSSEDRGSREGSHEEIWRRSCRGALHCRHHGLARPARTAARQVQRRGRRHHLPIGVHRQPRDHLCAGGQGGCGLFRPAQPRLHHRWMPAFGREDHSLRTQRSERAGGCDQGQCYRITAVP